VRILNLKLKTFKYTAQFSTYHLWQLHIHATVMGEWRYSSTILDLGTRWRWVVSFKPQPLWPGGNSPWFPLDRMLGGPQSQSVCCGVEENVLPMLGIKPEPSSPQLITITIELSSNLKLTYLQLLIFFYKGHGKF
jgi:hypothetical protein